MPEFVNPFSGVIPGRELTDRELARAIRLSIAAEEEAIHLYEALADATSNKAAKIVLQDIANEEKVHKGEFQRLLTFLEEDEEKWMAEGKTEVDELLKMIEEKNPPIPTVGDMKEE